MLAVINLCVTKCVTDLLMLVCHIGCFQRSFIESVWYLWQGIGHVIWDMSGNSFDIDTFNILLYRMLFAFSWCVVYVFVRAITWLSSEGNLAWIVSEQLAGNFFYCNMKQCQRISNQPNPHPFPISKYFPPNKLLQLSSSRLFLSFQNNISFTEFQFSSILATRSAHLDFLACFHNIDEEYRVTRKRLKVELYLSMTRRRIEGRRDMASVIFHLGARWVHWSASVKADLRPGKKSGTHLTGGWVRLWGIIQETNLIRG
jgi:hypothetical protein